MKIKMCGLRRPDDIIYANEYLDQADIRKPYFIAGGLTVENLPEILKKAEPYGIDISSGIETEGVKDREKMLKVIQCVRGGKDE